MLTKLMIKFSEPDISYYSASVFQGVLMQNIDAEYAGKMHIGAVRPYSQNIHIDKDKNVIWTINTLNDEAEHEIINKLADDSFKEFTIESKNKRISVKDKTLYKKTYKELFEESYFTDDIGKYKRIAFYTPTAFKSNGIYINYPSVDLIFRSLIARYNMCSDFTSLEDNGLLNEFKSKVLINQYKLKTVPFPLEGRRINAFIGEASLKSYGNEKLTRLMNMLLDFAVYSGIGIKTAIGMGAVKIMERKGAIQYG